MKRSALLCSTFLIVTSRLLFAGEFRVIPDAAKQGEFLQVYGTPEAIQARLNGKTIPLFDALGLMPIPVKTAAGKYDLEWLNARGVIIHHQQLSVLNAHYLVQNVLLDPALTELHSTPEERADVAKFFALETAVRFWQLPIHAPLQSCLTSPFGVQRAHNGKLTGDIHSGLDQRGAMGTPIHAAESGEVRLSGQYALHGGTVGIDHGQGLKSMYLHMSKIAVKVGDHVSTGDTIGFVGSTGRSTAPHLHWALYAQGEPVNPMQWLALQPCPKKAASQPRRSRKTRR